jgi:HEAT repeat protein
MTTTRHIAHCTVPVLLAGVLLCSAAGPARAQAYATRPTEAVATIPMPATLDEILKLVATYDGGIKSDAAWHLHNYVYAHKDDPAGRTEIETKLLAFLKLKTPVSPVARMDACRYLRLVAGDTALPALQAMLVDPKSADLALYAIQGIPGAAAEKALLQSLATATGDTKTAIVVALGERRSTAAVAAIVPLLKVPALAPNVAVALGRIGDAAAVTPLKAALPTATPALKPVLAGALLEAAGTFVAAKDTASAAAIYDLLAADASLPVAQRRAVLLGRIDTAGTGAKDLVLSMVGGTDVMAQMTAIPRVPTTFTADAVAPVCALVGKIGDGPKIALISALSGYPSERVLPTFLDAAKSPTDAVRIAALKAIGLTGGVPQVTFLAERAAAAKGVEQTTARAALGSLKSRAVDDAILAQFAKKPADAIAGELLLAIGERRIFPAKNTLVAALGPSSSPAIRLQAYRGLRTIGTPSDIPAVVDAMLAAKDDREQSEAEKTVLALAQKFESTDGRARLVRSRYEMEKDAKVRVPLLGLIGLIGDPSTLPLLRTALTDKSPEVYDAAVRALSAWPSSAAREDLMVLAKNAKDESQRLLALGGLIRVIGLDRYRDKALAVADLKVASTIAWRADEFKLILSALAPFAGPEALELANGFLQKADVAAEAKAAVEQIGMRLKMGANRQ